MSISENDSCSTCLFWKEIEAGRGKCRRYPPRFPKGDGEYPITDSYNWCGEYKKDKDK